MRRSPRSAYNAPAFGVVTYGKADIWLRRPSFERGPSISQSPRRDGVPAVAQGAQRQQVVRPAEDDVALGPVPDIDVTSSIDEDVPELAAKPAWRRYLPAVMSATFPLPIPTVPAPLATSHEHWSRQTCCPQQARADPKRAIPPMQRLPPVAGGQRNPAEMSTSEPSASGNQR